MRELEEMIIIPKCKYCGSAKKVVRFGRYKGVQRWWCKKCQKKFVSTDTLPKMKTPIRQIASALSMYYGGMSLSAIRRHIDQQYNYRPSESTIYGWLTRFSKTAVEKARDYKPEVGNVWIADETVLKIGGDKIWFWDLIDTKTRFLLASHMSFTRTTHDARVLLARAARRAEKPPKEVITDKLQAYLDGVELNFGGETKHIQAKGLTADKSTNIIERFHGSLKDRTKVMRGLKKKDTARLLMDGWLVHYNFFRPHEALGDKTPAEKAGITFPFKHWLDVVSSPQLKTTTEAESLPITTEVVRISPKPMRITKSPPRITPKPRRISGEINLGGGIVQDRRTGRRHLRLY